jgi:DNA-binding MurR/RpiR family transcriptional regulator
MAPPTGPEHRTLEKRIHAYYEALPASERALADLILEFPGDILFYSATALSERAGVSKATVTRLVQRLEYEDYREMQREVREAQETGAPIYLNTSAITPAREGDSLQRHLERDLMNLRQTFEGLNPADLDDIAQRVINAGRIWVLGFRNSHFFAAYVRRQLIQVRPDVVLLPAAGQVMMEDLAGAGPEDLVIAVGLRRRVTQLRRAMEVLNGLGVPIAYVTDRVAVATKKLATWTIACQTRGTSLFDSYVGVISVLNYLCTEVVALSGESGRVRLGRIEDLMELMDEIDLNN